MSTHEYALDIRYTSPATIWPDADVLAKEVERLLQAEAKPGEMVEVAPHWCPQQDCDSGLPEDLRPDAEDAWWDN